METRLSLRAEQKNLTRNRVLDAAVAVLDEKSFADTTMEDIARAAGVTRVTVYAHFAGKVEIVRALFERYSAATDGIYVELSAVPRWTRPAIRAWLEDAAALWREMAPTIRVLTAAGAAMAFDAKRPRDIYRASHERYVSLLADDRQRWRGTRAAQARQRSLMAIQQVESFLTLWLTGEWQMETADPLDLLTDAVCHLLGPAVDE